MTRKIRDNVKDDQELEHKDDQELELDMLLEEIPQATSRNLLRHEYKHVYGTSNDHTPLERQAIHGVLHGEDDDSFSQIKYPSVASPKSGFSLRSDDSFSSVHPENGSVTPPLFEDIKSSVVYGVSNYPNSFYSDSIVSDSPVRKRAIADERNLCANLSKMCLGNQYGNSCNFKDASVGKNELLWRDNTSLIGNNPINSYKHGNYGNFKRQFSDPLGVQSPFPPSPMNFDAERNPALAGLPRDYTMGNLFESRPCSRGAGFGHPQFNGFSGSVYSPSQQLINNYHYGGNLRTERTASYGGNPLSDSLLYPHQSGMNLMEGRRISSLPDSSLCTNLGPYSNLQQYNLHNSNTRDVLPSNVRIPQGGLEAITSEGSFIIHDDGWDYYFPVGGSDCLSGQSKGAGRGTSFAKQLQRLEPDNQQQVLGSYRSPEYNSLAEAQGHIYKLAKDQHGCRFLQKVFEEGTLQDVEVIFSEIIEHVVELMMDPFGNYLMQKLLEVCNEEQRMQILLMITKEPRQLVTISLNTHGTRVIQKLIQTLSTPQQKSLAVSALEPGFLALIKDLSGNHVIQHCLQFLGNEDKKFIFVAAAKYCVDIATHQHGCCVLQKCIDYSWGEHRKQLIAEISANALFLAQDQYGNYVVQYILGLSVPSATASIISQFQGNYVHLSTQKFSSHVIEKCLAVFSDEHRNRIIHELLSIPHFEQLLDDPHANYVLQAALKHCEVFVYNKLVDTIEAHKSRARNSPFSKKLLSQKLQKK
ncbi:hypothetical protein QN277_019968 [Acacia crassicarpa]|uniref:PUM-HD domain-containing protein n=1 Tax=Acacia crassicarpa TaxID=499986 RepID=A0AAE1KCF8_9FABA|nr:hypothetical protein QN277_019968 [Acacia crassicarpa]